MIQRSTQARRPASADPPPVRKTARSIAISLAAVSLLAGCPTTVTTAPDTAMPDAAMPDAAMPDAAMPDATRPDGGPGDAGTDTGIDVGIDVGPDGGPDASDVGPDTDVDGGRPAPVWTTEELATLATLTALPALPPDPTNAFADDADAADLGHALFFDERYSGPITVATSPFGAMGETGQVSCASCHGSQVMSDSTLPTTPTSVGTAVHTRNAPAIVNSAYYQWTNWGGRFAAQWELPPVVAEAGATMNSSRLAVVHHIYDHYRTEYEAVFGPMDPAIADLARFPATGRPIMGGGGPWEMMTDADRTIANRVFTNYGKAIQAYMRQLVSRTSDFDRFVAGDTTAISVDAQWGLRVFMGDGACVDCHSGAELADDQFHNLGVPQPTTPIDQGRFSSVPGLLTSTIGGLGPWCDDPAACAALVAGLTNPAPESTRGQFRTPTLRDLSFSAPYMHAGQFATLSEVIDFYNAGGSATPPSGTLDPLVMPLGLSEEQKADLLAFLTSLDSDPVPLALRTAP